jgi:hypothetical protein
MTNAIDDISDDQIDAFQKDGAVFIPGLFAEWTERWRLASSTT